MNGGALQTTLITAVAAGTPILLAGLGELLVERVGLFNVGIEGVMLMGAVVGFVVGVQGEPTAIALLAGAAAGALFITLVFTIPVLWLGAPEILSGFAAWFIGIGVSSQIGATYVQVPFPSEISSVSVPGLSDIPFIGEIFFNQPAIVYVAAALALIAAAVLRYTKLGLSVRAVGDEPDAAAAAGVSVNAMRLIYIALGGALTGLGGAVLSIIEVGGWRENLTAGRGFVALALVVFAARKPLNLLGASYLFGLLLILGSVGQAHGWAISSQLLDMLPYLATIAILVVTSRFSARRRLRTHSPEEEAQPAG